MKKKLLPFAAAALACAPAVHAAPNPSLIAIGKIDAHYQDLALDSAGALENGIAGNLLGGMGSGLAYAGGNSFLGLPDRGPNATSYNAAIDNTASFIPRIHSLRLSLAPSAAGSALPFTLTPMLTNTTLLFSKSALVYGDGTAYGVPNGAPALNDAEHFYFSGRSDNFDASRKSNYLADARLDPESLRVSPDGKFVYLSDEYGPYVYRFNRASGARSRVYTLPAKYAVTNLSPLGQTEIDGNTSGRVANKGMEGLAISPDGGTLYGAMQSPLIQDGGTSAPYTRIVKIDVATGAVLAEYAYELDNIGTVSSPKYPTVSDIVAVNDHQFLVDERDGKGLGDNSTAVFKKVYLIDIAGATDVSGLTGAAALAPAKLGKTLFLDLVAKLTAFGINAKDIPAKLEGLAIGPDVVDGGVTKHTLYVSNDNDYIATVTDSNHPSGIDNPNQFFVFAFTDTDLPGLVPQQITELAQPNSCH